MKKFLRVPMFLLLVSFGFASLHAYVYTQKHPTCGIHTLVVEHTVPSQCDDGLCAIHFVFHQSFVLPELVAFVFPETAVCGTYVSYFPHPAEITFLPLKPPIAT